MGVYSSFDFRPIVFFKNIKIAQMLNIIILGIFQLLAISYNVHRDRLNIPTIVLFEHGIYE